MKTRLFLVRHAEADGNVNRIFHGWTDSSITKNGHLQAQNIAKRVEKEDIKIIFSSPLTRTLQTANYIAKSLGHDIIKVEDLKEINGGDWENVPFEALHRIWPEHYYKWECEPDKLVMPNGESMDGFRKRITGAVQKILSENEGKNICVVTHGTAIKVLMCYFKGLTLDNMAKLMWQENTALSLIEQNNNNFDIIFEGDHSHLSDQMLTVANQGWQNDWKKSITVS